MKNIYQKLLAVKTKVNYIKQDGQVAFGNTKYRFAGSESVLKRINPVLIEQGLFLETEIISQDIDKSGNGYFTKLELKYTWINTESPDEKISIKWFAQGIDNSEKGIGKALTYAERYFLLKTFNCATGQDDPEIHDQINHQQQEKAQKKDVIKQETQSKIVAQINDCKNIEDLEIGKKKLTEYYAKKKIDINGFSWFTEAYEDMMKNFEDIFTSEINSDAGMLVKA